MITRKPDSGWYASGLRWIASGLVRLADAIDRGRAGEPTAHCRAGIEGLLDARHRANGCGV